MYQFYSRVPSISLNNSFYRQNQYSIDGSEDSVQGKKVFYVFKGQKEDGLYYLNATGNKIYGQFMDPFESYRRLKASISTDNGLEWGGTYQFLVYNPYSNAIQLSKLQLGIAYLDSYKRLEEVRSISINKALPETLAPGDTLRLEIVLPAPKASDPVYARGVISENDLYWGINGKAQRIKP